MEVFTDNPSYNIPSSKLHILKKYMQVNGETGRIFLYLIKPRSRSNQLFFTIGSILPSRS